MLTHEQQNVLLHAAGYNTERALPVASMRKLLDAAYAMGAGANAHDVIADAPSAAVERSGFGYQVLTAYYTAPDAQRWVQLSTKGPGGWLTTNRPLREGMANIRRLHAQLVLHVREKNPGFDWEAWKP